MTRIEKIEKHFGMTFVDVIKKLHLRDKRSLLSLSQESGVGRDAFQKQCEKIGLKLRGVAEARSLSAQRGEEHWAWGLTKETHPMYRRHSQRMLTKNPSKDKKTREKMSIRMAEHFKKNPWPQEIEFEKYLKKTGLEFIRQHPIKSFVIDFFIPELMLALEVDSKMKWGKERQEHANRRDRALARIGIKTLRFDKRKLSMLYILDILKANNVITKL